MKGHRGRSHDGPRTAKASRKRDEDAGDAGAATTEKLKGKDYERKLRKLHVELVRLQRWVQHKGLKICIVFEGRDGAGKGGTIKAITERVSPRVFRVVALPAPTEREKSQMYAQRYIPHLPAAGEIVIFDRSWYNRAGVERVMGFCSEEEVEGFLRVTPLVEQVMVHSGIILLKYWLEVSGGRADAAARRPDRGWPQDVEALADGSRVVHPLGRLSRVPATPCSRPRIRRGRRGMSPTRTTSGGRG